MKTIEEAAKEIEKVVNGKLSTAFKKGVEFSQSWISVDDELPEDKMLVQVFNKDCMPHFSHAYLENKTWMNPYNNGFLNPLPTHWRPIERK